MATVLYVDDDEAVARAVSLWLTRKGHIVHLAHDAARARALVASTLLDGVFADLWLGMDSGVELLEWIAARDPALGRRTALVTGDLFEAPRRDDGSGRTVFTKPFDLRAIEAQADSWSEPGEGGVARRDAGDPPLRPGGPGLGDPPLSPG